MRGLRSLAGGSAVAVAPVEQVGAGGKKKETEKQFFHVLSLPSQSVGFQVLAYDVVVL